MKAASIVARHFGQMDAVEQASVNELVELVEIGTKIGESIVAYFADEDNLLLIAEP